MKDKMKILSLLFLLSFTCFLTQCEGCRKTDPVTHRVLPNQVVYTLSCGFPFPYFDVRILNTSEGGHRYEVRDSYRKGISVSVNVLILAAGYLLLVLLLARGRLRLNRFLMVSLSVILLFSAGLLVPWFPDILKEACFYLYLFPVNLINSLLDYLKIDLRDNNIAPRVYLVVLILLVYHLISLIQYLRTLRKRTPRGEGA